MAEKAHTKRPLWRLLAWVVLSIVVGLPIIGVVALYMIGAPGAGRSLVKKAGLPFPTIVAHRGASYWAPEETRPAYRLARALGADYLELDVQRTKDGVLVAFHDTSLVRTTNAAKLFPGREDKGIGDFTWAELKRLDVGSWFNQKHPKRARSHYKGQRILTLHEVISIAESGQNKPGLYIETKSPERYPGIEKELVALLQKRGWLAKGQPVIKSSKSQGKVQVGEGAMRLLFQSFDKQSLLQLKKWAPGAARIYLISSKMAKSRSWKALLTDAKALGAGIGPVGYKSLPWHIAPAHRLGLLVHPYTLNPTWVMRLGLHFGADGFFTDRADAALRLVGRQGAIKDIGPLFDTLGIKP